LVTANCRVNPTAASYSTAAVSRPNPIDSTNRLTASQRRRGTVLPPAPWRGRVAAGPLHVA
jgi:hypothetical protein